MNDVEARRVLGMARSIAVCLLHANKRATDPVYLCDGDVRSLVLLRHEIDGILATDSPSPFPANPAQPAPSMDNPQPC